MNSNITTDDLKAITDHLDAQAKDIKALSPATAMALSIVSIALKDCMIAHTKKRIDALETGVQA